MTILCCMFYGHVLAWVVTTLSMQDKDNWDAAYSPPLADTKNRIISLLILSFSYLRY